MTSAKDVTMRIYDIETGGNNSIRLKLDIVNSIKPRREQIAYSERAVLSIIIGFIKSEGVESLYCDCNKLKDKLKSEMSDSKLHYWDFGDHIIIRKNSEDIVEQYKLRRKNRKGVYESMCEEFEPSDINIYNVNLYSSQDNVSLNIQISRSNKILYNDAMIGDISSVIRNIVELVYDCKVVNIDMSSGKLRDRFLSHLRRNEDVVIVDMGTLISVRVRNSGRHEYLSKMDRLVQYDLNDSEVVIIPDAKVEKLEQEFFMLKKAYRTETLPLIATDILIRKSEIEEVTKINSRIFILMKNGVKYRSKENIVDFMNRINGDTMVTK